MGPTALASLARTALDCVAHFGVVGDAVLERVGISRDVIELAEGRIPVADLMKIWEAAEELSGDPKFGLYAGENVVSARTISVVGFAARNSATLGECYGHTVRFAMVTNEASQISLTREHGRGVMIVGAKPGLPPYPRVYNEMAMAAYLSIGRKWTGQSWVPHYVAFQNPPPADLTEHHRVFGCELKFNAPDNRLVVPAHVLALPFGSSDPEILEYFREKATSLLAEIGEASLDQRVRQQIAAILPHKTPTLALVAAQLAMSARTLQRRLAEDNVTFASLVDDVRRLTTLRMLAAKDAEISAIAHHIGYRDLDSFRAAFQRWTGKSPRDYRRGNAG
ncbi:MAG: AraC family transcriptional regulator [Kofleriaceae bacterium]